MNVWLVNHYAVPPDAPGGTRHFGFAKELAELGHAPLIIASNFNHSTRSHRKLGSSQPFCLERVAGVNFLWIRTPGYMDNGWQRVKDMLVFAWGVLRHVLHAGLPRPDVVVGSSPHLFGGLSARLLARRAEVPFVLEVRDLWPQSLIDVGGLAPYHPFTICLEMLARQLYKSADEVICVAAGMEERIHQVNRNVRVTWIPNGIDMKAVPPAEPPPLTGPFTVVYAGAHGRANKLDLLLDSARVLHASGTSIRFLLIGDGPEKVRLRRRAELLGLSNVEFRDPVPKSQVYNVLREGHAFVAIVPDSPAYRYGTSFNKFFDYLAMARPTILASKLMSNNPFTESGSGLVVPPDDPKALADAVQKLASMPAGARWVMGLKGREYVERHHAFSVLARRLEEVLERSTRRRSPCSPGGTRLRCPGLVDQQMVGHQDE